LASNKIGDAENNLTFSIRRLLHPQLLYYRTPEFSHPSVFASSSRVCCNGSGTAAGPVYSLYFQTIHFTSNNNLNATEICGNFKKHRVGVRGLKSGGQLFGPVADTCRASHRVSHVMSHGQSSQ
jgi:hypothetical protein